MIARVLMIIILISLAVGALSIQGVSLQRDSAQAAARQADTQANELAVECSDLAQQSWIRF